MLPTTTFDKQRTVQFVSMSPLCTFACDQNMCNVNTDDMSLITFTAKSFIVYFIDNDLCSSGLRIFIFVLFVHRHFWLGISKSIRPVKIE